MSVVRWIFALLIVAVVVMVAMSSLKPRPVPPVHVQTVKAQRTTITRVVSAAGKLEPLQKINVSSNITGTLVDLQVGIGSVVKVGQYLGQIDVSRYKIVVDQQRAQAEAATSDAARARANLDRLKTDAERLAKLVERGAGNASDLEQAQGQVRMAEAELAATVSRARMAQGALNDAAKNLEWATLKSPVDGTVLSVNHHIGERVRGSDFAEDVVLTLASLTDMQVRIEIGEHDVVYVRPGQLATIEIDAMPDVIFKGKVIDSGRDAIVKNAGTDNEVTTFPVWVTLENPSQRSLSGMSAQVSIATESKANVIAVPIQAVTVRAAAQNPTPTSETAIKTGSPAAPSAPAGTPRSKLEKVVFVLNDGKVAKRKVATGLSSENLVEITEGLAPGEEIVEGPYRVLARQLDDGQAVKVVVE